MSWPTFLATLSMIAGPTVSALAQESNDGTSVPTAARIVDAKGAVWTIRTSDRKVLKDGNETGAGNAEELWYVNRAVWAWFGGYWWRWTVQWRKAGQTTALSDHPAMSTTPGLRLSVGPQRTAGCRGVTIRPGANIQSFVDANGPNTTFCLTIGIYKQQSVSPKNGDRFIGSFDGTNGSVLDGGNATAHAFYGTANYVVIKNMIIRNYANQTQDGSVQITGAYLLLENNEISYATRGAGIYVTDHALVIANNIHHNAEEGYSGHGTGVTFDSNEIAYNNPTHGYWDGGEQGGGKASDTQHITVWYNYSHDNWGPAFWTDYNNVYTIYWYNRSFNDGSGIEHEISYNASIIGNDLGGMGPSDMPGCLSGFFTCAGVQIENSGGATGSHAGIIEIADNTIRPGPYGRSIAMRQQARGIGNKYSAGEPFRIRNVWVHHNNIDMTDASNVTDGQVGVAQDTGDTRVFSSSNIRFDYNTYMQGRHVNQFVWMNSPYNSFTQWQSYGFDVHGTAR